MTRMSTILLAAIGLSLVMCAADAQCTDSTTIVNGWSHP